MKPFLRIAGSRLSAEPASNLFKLVSIVAPFAVAKTSIPPSERVATITADAGTQEAFFVETGKPLDRAV